MRVVDGTPTLASLILFLGSRLDHDPDLDLDFLDLDSRLDHDPDLDLDFWNLDLDPLCIVQEKPVLLEYDLALQSCDVPYYPSSLNAIHLMIMESLTLNGRISRNLRVPVKRLRSFILAPFDNNTRRTEKTKAANVHY